MSLFKLIVKHPVSMLDCATMMVVEADNEEVARLLANDRAMDEGQIWDDHAAVSCEEMVITKNSVMYIKSSGF